MLTRIDFSKYLQAKPIKPKSSPVHRLVDYYLELKGITDYKELYSYPRLCREAKILLENCGGNEEDAHWAIYKLHEDARHKDFSWTLGTCNKYVGFYEKK